MPMHATRCGCKAPCKEQAGNRELSSSPIFYNHRIVLRSARALMLRSRAARARSRNPHSSRELRGVSKHEGALGRSSSSFETRASAFALASPSRMRAHEHAFQSCSRCQTAHRVPAARFLRPGCAPLLRQPNRGMAERRETFGCSGTRWACPDASKTRVNALMTPHARHLARRLASHDAGRSPLGAPPWRFWAPGPRFSPRHLRRIGHSEFLAPRS